MATKVGFQLESSLASKHLTDAKFIQGGYLVANTLEERNNLPKATENTDGIIVNGSICYVIETQKYYKYNSTEWVEDIATISELNQKQDALVSGTNIKTVNGNSLLGAGNVAVNTYQPFPNGQLNGNLQQVVSSIMSFPGKKQGMAYLGGIAGSCTPFGYGNVECTVTFMTDYIALLSVSSSDISPHYWLYNTAQNDYQWRAYEIQSNKVTSINSSSTDIQYPSAKCVYNNLASKQNILTAGQNITIVDNVISATGQSLPITADDLVI